MKRTKQLLSLLLALVLALSLVSPALAAETDDASGVTADTLTQLLGQAPVFPEGASASDGITNQEAAAALLLWAGMEESQLGAYPADYNSMADSLGMTYDPEAACTQESLTAMKAVADQLYDALHADKLEPLFLNGMAQPIFPYTSGAAEEGYSNETSDIIRFFVYVETNYDTDGDGKLDLVKALVQLPRAAAEGDYQAATIYEARPYITGCTPFWGETDEYGTDGYDIDSLYNQPAARTPAGEAVSTLDHAAQADSSEWYYWNEYEDMYDYEDLDWYDYYLVRGFAVVECGGLGTLGSDGFETCGTDLEIDAFKCVIEWLHGDRVAYTDKESNIPIEADWSSGSVGMTGRSYAGTTQFGLATTGVEGLKTIVPVAGIASWYEYTNSQGISTGRNPAYSDILALYCAGRYLDPLDWASIQGKYGNYLYQLQLDQLALNGDYGDHWATRDYTLNAENIQCPALIVHGLNDDNVRTKEFDLMYQAYEEAGVPVKLLLHQDGHLTPTYPSQGISFLVNGQSYDELLNQWFSHYLYGVDNDVENLPAVTAQSNLDTKQWNTYSDWKTDASVTLTGENAGEATSTISSDYDALGVDRNNWKDVFTAGSTASSAMYTMDVTSDTVIKGTVAVSFRAATTNGEEITAPRGETSAAAAVDHDTFIDPSSLDHDNFVNPAVNAGNEGATVSTPNADLIDRDGLMVSAMLVDIAPEGETFPACNTAPTYVNKTVIQEDGAWQGGGLQNLKLVELNTTDVSYKVIARGWMDLCNPGAGYDSASAATKVSLKEGQYYDYTLYLQPNLYEVEAGHSLALVVYAYEPGKAAYTQNYTITLDNSTVSASIPVDDPMASFTDVTTGSWFYDAAKYAVQAGIMNGTSATTFSPNKTTTRAMAVTMLYRMEGEPAVSGGSAFTDVPANQYYAEAVAWAAANDIVTGTSATTFSPNKDITREQLTAILYRYAQYKGCDVSVGEDTNILSYGDAETVSTYAIPAMQWAVGAGIINGIKDNLVPKGNATRAQMATMLMRFDAVTAQ